MTTQSTLVIEVQTFRDGVLVDRAEAIDPSGALIAVRTLFDDAFTDDPSGFSARLFVDGKLLTTIEERP
jgi:hypothetical protein